MINKLKGIFLVFFIGLIISSCRSVKNYTDPDGPLYEGSFATDIQESDGTIKVVTWNIAFAEEIESAIQDLKESDELKDADALLLQEMDEEGVERIAEALGLNYVYYPASVHSRHGNNFGNAILSRWPLSEPGKVILPHRNPRNDQIRVAARALITMDGKAILVYSVHTETFWLGPDARKDQIDALVEDVAGDYEYIIVGGDFNTLTPDSERELVDRFEEAGLEWSSSGTGPSVGLKGVGLTLDSIFSKGFKILDSGVWSGSESSDHNPLWVELEIE